jgi:hypothetical protein
MSDLNLPVVRARDFAAAILRLDGTVRVRFSGRADGHAREAVGEMVDTLHELVQRHAIKSVTIDVRDTTLLSSQCARRLVTWIHHVSSLELERQYKIRFIADLGAPWQTQTLAPLRQFAVHLVRIDSMKAKRRPESR